MLMRFDHFIMNANYASCERLRLPLQRMLSCCLKAQIPRELVYRAFPATKLSQLFLGTYDETLSVAMSVHNPDRSPFAIER
jgi:hypothetical protein